MQNHDLWLSLVEKAFLKAHGGYDFPGSLSTQDLYALTQWLPENINLDQWEGNKKEKLWRLLKSGMETGDFLATVATPPMSRDEAERLGLVELHAYAVLEILEAEGQRLLMLKNPWSRKRWRGKFSPEDEQSWTPGLKYLLHFDSLTSMNKDQGLFWIDFDSLCSVFDVACLNWNPSLFRYQDIRHLGWSSEAWRVEGESDNFFVGMNPQLSLSVYPDPQGTSDSECIFWIVITRHVRFFRRTDLVVWMSLLAYEDDPTEADYRWGKREASEPPLPAAYHRVMLAGRKRLQSSAVFTNTPNVTETLRFKMPPKNSSGVGGMKTFTLVPSVYLSKRPDGDGQRKTSSGGNERRGQIKGGDAQLRCAKQLSIEDMGLSVRVCATTPFTLQPVDKTLRYTNSREGFWNSKSAGGACDSPRFGDNPQWLVTFSPPFSDAPAKDFVARLRVILFSDSSLKVAVHVARPNRGSPRLGGLGGEPDGEEEPSKIRGLFQHSTIVNCRHVAGGAVSTEVSLVGEPSVVLIPCTIQSGQTAKFSLHIESDCSFSATFLF
mmetsp:Transcript_26205/g.51452  ORF Transcript_26205/g.51452 Transcript_26205/m.51452 type:complete len:549 (-) Transcript_26205:201-1847(-)